MRFPQDETPPRIGLAIPRSQLYVELGQMIAEGLVRLGCDPVAVTNEMHCLPKVDALLVVGDGRKLTQITDRINATSPATPSILWHMEPVLPPTISSRAEELSRRVAGCDWNRLPNQWRAFFKMVLPARTQLQYALRAWYARGARRQMALDGCCDFDAVDANSIYFAAAQYEWLVDVNRRRTFDTVFTSSLPRWQFLERHGIATEFVPVGYHPGWGTDAVRSRTESVVFIGRTRRTLRHTILTELQSELADRGIRLSLFDRNCFGRDRAELLARTKILLTLAKFPWDHAGIRLMMAAASGAMVVSGPRGDAAPFRVGEHFAQAKTDELADAITFFIENDGERRRMADSLQRFATEEWTLENSLTQILTHSAPAVRARMKVPATVSPVERSVAVET